jgi:uncharacterized metal-binding protein YceD (DUF177 family)
MSKEKMKMTAETPPEFSNIVPLSEIGAGQTHLRLSANAAERAALALRFGLFTLDRFDALVALSRDGEGILAKGSFTAALTQPCVATGASVPAQLEEDFSVRVLPETGQAPEAEIELEAGDCDTMFHDGRRVDVGEVAAQSLGLAINLYPRSPDAASVLKQVGVKDEDEVGPFAALAALRKGQD